MSSFEMMLPIKLKFADGFFATMGGCHQEIIKEKRKPY
jgi:hypothetical protein